MPSPFPRPLSSSDSLAIGSTAIFWGFDALLYTARCRQPIAREFAHVACGKSSAGFLEAGVEVEALEHRCSGPGEGGVVPTEMYIRIDRGWVSTRGKSATGQKSKRRPRNQGQQEDAAPPLLLERRNIQALLGNLIDFALLRELLPSLRVTLLGLEISGEAFDSALTQCRRFKSLDLTDEEYGGLTLEGVEELVMLCPTVETIILWRAPSPSWLADESFTQAEARLKVLCPQLQSVARRDARLSDCVQLQVKRPEDVTPQLIRAMVLQKDVAAELARQDSAGADRIPCFRCQGSGLLSHEPGPEPEPEPQEDSRSQAAKPSAGMASWLFQDAEDAWKRFDGPTIRALEAAFADGGAVVQLAQGSADGGQTAFEVDVASMTMSAVTGDTHRIRRVDEATAGGAGRPCWVCHGTGLTSRHLTAFDSAETAQTETPCLVCYDASSYCLSTECDHYYCKECIVGSLEAMLESGQLPAFCPMCRADANGGDLSVGRIDGRALAFLQITGVITKEFLFRFQKQNEKKDEVFFACPGNCSRFLIEQPPSFVVDKLHNSMRMKLGACPCGTVCCVRCHKLEDNALTHSCPASQSWASPDPASMALMAQLGKRCPVSRYTYLCRKFEMVRVSFGWRSCALACTNMPKLSARSVVQAS